LRAARSIQPVSNIWLEDRNGVRTPMQWEPGSTAGFSESSSGSLYAPVINDETYGPARVNVKSQRADTDSLLNMIQHMIAIRKQHKVFGWGEFRWIDMANASVAAFQRSYQDETILALPNLSSTTQHISHLIQKPATSMTDLLTGQEFFPANGTLEIELEPYQYLWLK
jgi:maltose alpha-D-glucosyltransferase/alpha-amylase